MDNSSTHTKRENIWNKIIAASLRQIRKQPDNLLVQTNLFNNLSLLVCQVALHLSIV